MMKNISNNKTNIMVLLIIVGAIVLCCSLWFTKLEYRINTMENEVIVSQNGVWDLTKFDFESGIVVTSGKEQYITGELLTPDEFEQNSDKVQVGLPKESPVNTSKITLVMPDNRPYTIMGTSFDFAERIYINGELMGEIGTVSTDEITSEPGYEYLKFTVIPKDKTIEIVRQSNNFVHRDNGIASHILIGEQEKLNAIYAKEYGITGVIIGLFFAIAMTHIFMFYIFKKHRVHLYFALLSLTWGLRMGVTGVKVFAEWFNFLPWEIMFRLEYISVPVTCAMILLVTDEIYKNTLPKIFLRAFTSGFLLYAVCCLFVPTLPLSYSMIGVQVALILASILLIVFVVIKAVSLIRSKQMLLKHTAYLISIIPFVFATVHDALYYNAILIFGVSVILIDLSLMILVVTQTAVIYFDTSNRIITTYREKEQISVEAQSLRQAGLMKEEFLRTLTHEMQIPLTTVSGYAQLAGQILKEDNKLNRGELHEKMRIIDDEARKLSRQVLQLLDASAMENGTFKLHRERVDLNEVLQKISTLHFPVMSDAGIKLKIEVKNDLPPVFVDRERIVQVILNLITNSIKHSECSQISLIAKVTSANYGDEYDTKSNFAQITINDNGIGIAKDMQANLFEEYNENRSAKGNGLGLYITAKTVKAHGGEIIVQSEINKGTSITFTMPVWEENANDHRKT